MPFGIEEATRELGLGFGDAAIHLGLISREELAEAVEEARQPSKPDEGIVEGAIHKLFFNRGMPVKYVGMVKAGPALIMARDPDTSYSEQIRALRTELMLLTADHTAATQSWF